MGFLEKYFHIITTRNCPLYDKGNRFKLSGVGFECLEKKPVCLFLAKTISEIAVFSLDETKPIGKPKHANQEYNCPGCSGFIKFSAEEDKHYATPHMQILAAAERRRQMNQTGSIINLLSSFPFFQALDEDILKEIVFYTTLRKYQPGQTVLLRGQNGTNMFIILAGKVALINQKREEFAYLGNGEIFGEMSLLSGTPVSATIKAVETLKVLVISSKDLQQILTKYPFFQSEFMKLLMQRLAASNIKKSLPSSGIGGQLNEISAAELFQMFHENTKSGKIDLQLARGKARVIFQNGEIVVAQYQTLNGIEAFYAILKENNGTFQYSALSSQEETREMRPIGGFMKLLMEGLQKIDEENATK